MAYEREFSLQKIASAAQEKAHDKSNKTVNAAHILAAVKELDIGTQKGELEEILNEELKGGYIRGYLIYLTNY